MALFNNPKLSDCTLIFQEGNNRQLIHAHSQILCNYSEYFLILLEKFKQDNKKEYVINCEDPSIDVFIIKCIYESSFEFDHYSSIEKLQIALRAQFYQFYSLEEKCIKNFLQFLKPEDFTLILQFYKILKFDQGILTKLLSNFYFLIPDRKKNFKELQKLDSELFDQVMLSLIQKPIFVSNNTVKEMQLTKYSRNLTRNEFGKYSHIPNISKLQVSKLPSFVIFKEFIQYELNKYLYKLNFIEMTSEELKYVIKNANDVKIIREANDLLLHKLQEEKISTGVNLNDFAKKLQDDALGKIFSRY